MTDEAAALDELRGHLAEALRDAEQRGADADAVAELLERYAASAREGYTELPEDRGRWWVDHHATRQLSE